MKYKFLIFIGLTLIVSGCSSSILSQKNPQGLPSSDSNSDKSTISTLSDLPSTDESYSPLPLAPTSVPNFFITAPANYGIVNFPVVLESGTNDPYMNVQTDRVDYYAIGNYDSEGNWQGCGDFPGNYDWHFCGTSRDYNTWSLLLPQFFEGIFQFEAVAYNFLNQVIGISESNEVWVQDTNNFIGISNPEEGSVQIGAFNLQSYLFGDFLTNPKTYASVVYFGRGNWAGSGNETGFTSCANPITGANWNQNDNWSVCGTSSGSPYSFLMNLKSGTYQFFARLYSNGLSNMQYIDSRVVHIKVKEAPQDGGADGGPDTPPILHRGPRK